MKPAISGEELSSRQAAFNSLTLMGHMKQDIQVYGSGSPYLAYYSKLVGELHSCTYITVPALIQLSEPSDNAVQPNGMKDSAA